MQQKPKKKIFIQRDASGRATFEEEIIVVQAAVTKAITRQPPCLFLPLHQVQKQQQLAESNYDDDAYDSLDEEDEEEVVINRASESYDFYN